MPFTNINLTLALSKGEGTGTGLFYIFKWYKVDFIYFNALVTLVSKLLIEPVLVCCR